MGPEVRSHRRISRQFTLLVVTCPECHGQLHKAHSRTSCEGCSWEPHARLLGGLTGAPEAGAGAGPGSQRGPGGHRALRASVSLMLTGDPSLCS